MREKIARLKAKAGVVDFSGTYDSNPVRWIETYFYIPETNAPIVLEPYQRAVINEALRKENGQFVYSLILYSDLKKSAKSTIAAAICLYLAWHTPWESVRIVANDLKQANSRTFYYIERAIRLNPVLNAVCKRRLYHIELPNNTTIDAIPVDPKGEAGGGDLVTCFTELWAFKNEAAKTLWSETTLSPLKFGKSLRWCESYAGFEGESPILEQLYESGVKSGSTVDVGIPGLELYQNSAGRMLTLWNTVPRCPWQTKEYYAQESAVLTPEEMDRIHGNKWASATLKFIPIQWWDDCLNSALADLQPGKSMCLGIDAGVKSDCFAIVGVTMEAGRNGFKIPTVRYCRIWIPPKGGKIRFSNPDDKYDREYPEGEIRYLAKTHRIAAAGYDPKELEEFVSRLERDVNFEEINQGNPRLIADKRLYDAIREGYIQHKGEPDLRQHINNADREDTDTNKMRIVKRQDSMKIDACIALSMANYIAGEYNI